MRLDRDPAIINDKVIPQADCPHCFLSAAAPAINWYPDQEQSLDSQSILPVNQDV